MPVTTCDKARERLKAIKNTLGLPWREIAKMAEFQPIPFGTLERFATTCYEPKRPEWRRILGLPSFAPAPVCPKCGVVHVTKRCTAGSGSRRRKRITVTLSDDAIAYLKEQGNITQTIEHLIQEEICKKKP